MAEPQENIERAESYELEDVESSEEPADQDTSSIDVSDCSDSSVDDWQLISSESSAESDSESVSSSSSSSSGSGTSCSFVRVSSPCSSRSSSVSEPVTPVVQECVVSEAVKALTTPQIKAESPVGIPCSVTSPEPSQMKVDLASEQHVIDDVTELADTSPSSSLTESSTLTNSSGGRDPEMDTSCMEQIECIQVLGEEASPQPSQTVLIRQRSQASAEEPSPSTAEALSDRSQKRSIVLNSRPWPLVSLAILLVFVFTTGFVAGILLVKNMNSAKESAFPVKHEPTNVAGENLSGKDGINKHQDLVSSAVHKGDDRRTCRGMGRARRQAREWARARYVERENNQHDSMALEKLGKPLMGVEKHWDDEIKGAGHSDEYNGDNVDEQSEEWDDKAKESELKSVDVDASGAVTRKEEHLLSIESDREIKDDVEIKDEIDDLGAGKVTLKEGATSLDDIDTKTIVEEKDGIYAEVNGDNTIETDDVEISDENDQKPDETQALHEHIETDEQQRRDEEPHVYLLRQLHKLIQLMISKGLVSEKEGAQLYYLPALIRQELQRARENIPWLQSSLHRLTSQLSDQLQVLVSDLQPHCQRTVSSATESIKSTFEDFLKEMMKHQPTIYSTLFTWQETMKEVSDSVIKQFYTSDDGTERRSKERSSSKQEQETQWSRDRNEDKQASHEGPKVDDQTDRSREDLKEESTSKKDGFGQKLKNKYKKLFKNSKRLMNSVKELVSKNLLKIPGEVNNIAQAIRHNDKLKKFSRKLREKAADLNEDLMEGFSKLSKYMTKLKSKFTKGYDEENQWKKTYFKKQSKLQKRVKSAHSLPIHHDDWGELYTDLYDFAFKYSTRAVEIKQNKWIMCQMQWWNRAAYIHTQCYDVLEPWQLKWKKSGDSEPEEADGAWYWGRSSQREASDVSDDWYLHPRPVVVDDDLGDRSGHWWLRRHQHYHKSPEYDQ